MSFPRDLAQDLVTIAWKNRFFARPVYVQTRSGRRFQFTPPRADAFVRRVRALSASPSSFRLMNRQFSRQCAIALAVATGMFAIGRYSLGTAFLLAAVAVEVMPANTFRAASKPRLALFFACVVTGAMLIVL